MYKQSIETPAKINLGFRVLGVKENMHLVQTVLYSLKNLKDEVSLIIDETKTGGFQGVVVEGGLDKVPVNKDNLVYKAASEVFKMYKIDSESVAWSFEIKKRIPVAGGMAGGSANAAGAILLMQEFLNNEANGGLSPELLELAARIGADVPFCLLAAWNMKNDVQITAAFGENFGEKLTEIKTELELEPKIHQFKSGLSTPEAFAKFDSMQTNSTLLKMNESETKLKNIVQALEDNNKNQVVNNIFNDLEPAASELSKETKVKLFELREAKKTAILSGSGPTVLEF